MLCSKLAEERIGAGEAAFQAKLVWLGILARLLLCLLRRGRGALPPAVQPIPDASGNLARTVEEGNARRAVTAWFQPQPHRENAMVIISLSHDEFHWREGEPIAATHRP